MKRFFDLIFLLIVSILFSPIFISTVLLILIFEGRPIFFKQDRLGMNNKVIKIIKFRTMNRKKTEGGVLMPDKDRTTWLGHFLRKSSIDELPSFWNVFINDMSFVGPRPLRARYLKRYTPEQARRHEVKPGITGWAQINGRNSLTWEKRFLLDIWYVENHSLVLDFKILFLTIFVVLFSKNVNSSEENTMEEFLGTKD